MSRHFHNRVVYELVRDNRTAEEGFAMNSLLRICFLGWPGDKKQNAHRLFAKAVRPLSQSGSLLFFDIHV